MSLLRVLISSTMVDATGWSGKGEEREGKREGREREGKREGRGRERER